MPALSARPGDLDPLVDHLLGDAAARLERPVPRLSPEARARLLQCRLQGNVRQLKEVLERACALCDDGVVGIRHLPASLAGSAEPAAAQEWPIGPLAEVERRHILRVLAHVGGNKKAAAEVLAIDRSTLYAKLRQYGCA